MYNVTYPLTVNLYCPGLNMAQNCPVSSVDTDNCMSPSVDSTSTCLPSEP